MERKLLEKWEELNEHLLLFIRKRIKNMEDAEDILQEVYIKLHENIGSLRDEEKMVSWIYQITRNTINNCYKRCYKIKGVEFEENYHLTEEEEDNLNDEIIVSMKRFMEDLPEDYREVIRLHEFENLTHRELGNLLGMNENTSKSKLKRGRERLRKLLDECCTFQLDRFGNVLNYEKNKK
ncbi:RNA polymerase sigma factor SigZ [Propionigenium maris DSM 9537]|uniref:RNA polymerase sigma factor SigZ n=1 Tax=Propionigenium maris DSM 9537 TaxID=1123000 RepID=A0A9W6LNY6_9FUSO|nr:sigma-70 family RNA polymerase sigma factor [Propionigenium maris]GLI57424.1 RNA polymerase sigma factor SigZ [Propionigenium maris DSM 9537]